MEELIIDVGVTAENVVATFQAVSREIASVSAIQVDLIIKALQSLPPEFFKDWDGPEKVPTITDWMR